MDKFLQTHNLPRLNHKEIEQLNKPIMSKVSESIIKNLPPKKGLGLDPFMMNSTEHLKKNPSQTLPKKKKKMKRRKYSQTHFKS